MSIRGLLEKAVAKAGSQAKLGKLIGYSQHAIWHALKDGRVSPRMALRIDRALGGAIPAEKLCPDLYNQKQPDVCG